MTQLHPVLTDLGLVEAPRWHDDRLVFSDWGHAPSWRCTRTVAPRRWPRSRACSRSVLTAGPMVGCWSSPRRDSCAENRTAPWLATRI